MLTVAPVDGPYSPDRLYEEAIFPLYDPLRKAPPEELDPFLFGLYGTDDPESDIFVAEAVSDAYTNLPIGEARLLELLPTTLQEAALRSLTAVNRETNLHVDAVFARLPDNIRPNKTFLAACMAVSEDAHAGQFRASSPDRSYFRHPLESAAMGNHVLDSLIQAGHPISEVTKDLIVGLTLMHDTVEEGMGKEGMYFDFSRNRNYNPLLLRRITERAGEPFAPFAAEAARSLEHVTHVKSRSWMRDYQGDYIEGRVCQNLLTSLAKAPEIHHNDHIEPHPIPTKAEKNTIKYGNAMGAIEESVVAFLEARGEYWGHEYFEQLLAIGPGDIPAMVDKLYTSIYDFSLAA